MSICLRLLQARVQEYLAKTALNWKLLADYWFAKTCQLFLFSHDIIKLLICAIVLSNQQGSYIDVANILGYKEFVKLVEVSGYKSIIYEVGRWFIPNFSQHFYKSFTYLVLRIKHIVISEYCVIQPYQIFLSDHYENAKS